jgi:hypothetical protein
MKRDLTKFSEDNLLIWIVAFALMEFPMRYFFLNIVGGKNVSIWYNFKEFSVYNVIAGDLFYVLVGIIISYRIYNYLFKNESNLIKFFIVFLVVQIIGDLLFYTVIKNYPKNNSNRWINFFKNYTKNAGLYALFGDSLYILIWTLVAVLIKDLNKDILYSILFTFLFILSIIDES